MLPPRYHIGLRTAKTALAVALALLFASLRGSPVPLFAAIGAIVAMSRTLQDAVRACFTQLGGIVCGTLLGLLFFALFPNAPAAFAGVGVVLVILCCNALHIEFAVPLACIVFISISLMPDGSSPIAYGANRFIDTAIGLLTALVLNIFIKPYNNRAKISQMMDEIYALYPAQVSERVLHSRYPDLSALRDRLHLLAAELTVFEHQPSLHPAQRTARRQEAAYLRGCEQLLVKMADELTSLCTMDVSPVPSAALCARLTALGLSLPQDLAAHMAGFSEEDRIVQDFHLKNLLDAGDFFCALNDAP